MGEGRRTAYDGNAVYEYERFEDKQPGIQALAKKKPAERPKKGGAGKTVAGMLLVVALASTLVYTRVVQTELANEYNIMVSKANALENENAALRLQLETKLSLENIETYAKEKLAMSEQKNQQVEYVEFDAPSKVEVIEQESFWHNLLSWFQGLFEKG